MFYWKLAILSSAIILMWLRRHTLDVGIYFGMNGEKGPSYTTVQIRCIGGFIFKWVVTTLILSLCETFWQNKGLVRRGLNQTKFNNDVLKDAQCCCQLSWYFQLGLHKCQTPNNAKSTSKPWRFAELKLFIVLFSLGIY